MNIPPLANHPFAYTPSDIQQGYDDGYAAGRDGEFAVPCPSRSKRYKDGFFEGLDNFLCDQFEQEDEEERDIQSHLSRAGYYREEGCQ